MLWFLRLLGAPADPDENMAWQYRHPARVAFAFATLLSAFFSTFLLASTQKPTLAFALFLGSFAFLFVLAYVGARVRIARARVRIARARPHGDAPAGGTA